MGLFDDFFNEREENKSFLNYVKSLSLDDLINTIDSTYRKLKGESGLVPYMGEFGCIEFAGILLMWEYTTIFRDINNYLYGNLLIALADQIGCTFNHMGALECSDRIDNIVNNFADIMSYNEWREVYDYLKENYAEQIRMREFNKCPDDRLEYDGKYYEFIRIYNSLTNISDVFDYYEQEGLGIKRLLYMLLKY